MISIEEVLPIHTILMQKFGGQDGVRDLPLLDSALNRPFVTFDGQELYPSPIEKAAALLESIVINHPFVDGNKRIGYVLMRLILLQNDIDIQATQADKYDLVIAVAEGRCDKLCIEEWIVKSLIKS